jgi:hypothetical protein
VTGQASLPLRLRATGKTMTAGQPAAEGFMSGFLFVPLRKHFLTFHPFTFFTPY